MTVILLLLALLLAGCGKPEVNVEAFVVTKDAGNVKLGLVTVSFLTDEQFKAASDTNTLLYKQLILNLNAADAFSRTENLKCIDTYTRFYNSYMDLSATFKKKGDAMEAEQASRKAQECKEKADEYQKTVDNYHTFTTDYRAEAVAIQMYLDSLKDDIIHDKTDADGKFKVELKNTNYHVVAFATTQSGDKHASYYWNFEYKPNGKHLFLSNDNLYHISDDEMNDIVASLIYLRKIS